MADAAAFLRRGIEVPEGRGDARGYIFTEGAFGHYYGWAQR